MKFAFLMYHGVEPIDLAAIGVISMARRVMPELSYLTVAATHDLQNSPTACGWRRMSRLRNARWST